jgi:predicted nucleotidyltransferase
MEAIHLIKHKGTRKVLETLVKFPNRQFTINELAKEAEVPFASTWRLVQRLEPAGIIETSRIGRSVVVKLHRSDYLESILSILKISQSPQAFTAQALEGLLKKERGVKEAYLFGSVARGEENLASDIDIAILIDRKFDANRFLFEVYERFGTKLVPITFQSKKELIAFLADKDRRRLK